MSNNLHERATRVVSAALFPAFLGIAGALIWHLQPPVPPIGASAPRVFDDNVYVPDLRSRAERPESFVAPVPKPAPRIEPEKTKHCDEYAMYGGSDEKVLICEWR